MSREQKIHSVIYSFSGLLLVGFIVFGHTKNRVREVESIEIHIEEQNGNFFTDQIEILDLMTDSQQEYLEGKEVSELDPKELEIRIETNPFVKDAQVHRDLKGNLKVKVVQSQPIARLYNRGKGDHYIDTEGRILPIAAKHTARVPLLELDFENPWTENLHESAYGDNMIALLSYIDQHDFWRAQIAHVIVSQEGEITLLPQVTKQEILFGTPENIEEKFDKLMTFYKEILPVKGWNHYDQVNLKFKNQIICE